MKPVKEKQENNPLTTRATEILALIAAGKSNSEIFRQLHITIGTVKVHVLAILQKLEVRDRTSAAIMAIQQNLVLMGYDQSKRI
ncbi:MAG TPA: LuxR C-terminal-related transcriptional regulator [Coleofasciculaceae cyanobacterium]